MSDASSFRETMRAARDEILRDCESMNVTFRRTQRVHWEKLAGPLLAEMLQSRQGAERYLEHPEPLVRMAAIEVLTHHWKPDPSLARSCQRMASEDTDSRVRNVAIGTFAFCFRDTDDPKVGHILAAIVRDERQPMEFRSAAYKGLFWLGGRPLPLWEGLYADPPTDFPFPEEVDWSLVDSYLREK